MGESAEARAVRLRGSLNTDDQRAVARALLDELGLSGQAREVLEPWVLERVTHVLSRFLRRSRTGGDSRSRRGGTTRHRAGTVGRGAGREAFERGPLDFLDDKVLVDGSFKQYRHLTPADHQARMRMHQGHARAAEASVRTHRWALGELNAHGAGCLDEIPPGVLAAELPGFRVRV